MAVAVKSAQGQHQKTRRSPALNSKQSRRQRSPQSLTVVESLKRREPSWLPLVVLLRNFSTPLAVGGVVIVLALYGMNAVLKREWGEQYARLLSAQRRQGALVTETERQKYQVPLTVETSPQNFVPQTQKNTLFLNPDNSAPAPEKPLSPRPSELSTERLPIGY